jgi:hypothetical protein
VKLRFLVRSTRLRKRNANIGDIEVHRWRFTEQYKPRAPIEIQKCLAVTKIFPLRAWAMEYRPAFARPEQLDSFLAISQYDSDRATGEASELHLVSDVSI